MWRPDQAAIMRRGRPSTYVVDEYVLLANVTQAYEKADRSSKKKASNYITDGKRKDYTPPPMPKR